MMIAFVTPIAMAMAVATMASSSTCWSCCCCCCCSLFCHGFSTNPTVLLLSPSSSFFYDNDNDNHIHNMYRPKTKRNHRLKRTTMTTTTKTPFLTTANWIVGSRTTTNLASTNNHHSSNENGHDEEGPVVSTAATTSTSTTSTTTTTISSSSSNTTTSVRRRNDSATSTTAADTNETIDGSLLYSDSAWKAYTIAMEEMMTRPGVVKKTTPAEIDNCRRFLFSRGESSSATLLSMPRRGVGSSNSSSSNPPSSSSSLSQFIEQQNTLFLRNYNYTKREHEFVTRCLVYVGDFCAKPRQQHEDNGLDRRDPILVAWNKLTEMGWMPRENSFSTYMYILSSNTDTVSDDVSSSTSTVYDDALLEIVKCHGLLYGSNEKTVAIQMKNLIRRGDIAAAEDLLTALEQEAHEMQSSLKVAVVPNNDDDSHDLGLRLRTFLPLLEYYCECGDGESILRVYHRMNDAPGTYLDAEAYALILSSLAKHGYFESQVGTTNAAENNTTTFGPALFETIARAMADDILDIGPGTASMLEEGFRLGLSNSHSVTALNFVAEYVQIPSNCTCPASGATLRLLKLDDRQRQHVHDTLKEMVHVSAQEFLQKVNGHSMTSAEDKSEGRALQAITDFSEWLDNREALPYTTIVDGANVAYYGHSNVHYSSVRALVEYLMVMGEHPLVVMPAKYVQKSFRAGRNRYYQTLTDQELETIEWLQENDMMYVVPRLCLDDYFWMLASVSNQTTSRQGTDLTVPVGDTMGRFPGMRPMIISNDQMRDHKLTLLEPREFRRWCSCHIVNYHLSLYEDDERGEGRQVDLTPADYFSREIQGNMHPSGVGNVWHFPISNSTDWLCIWPAIQNPNK